MGVPTLSLAGGSPARRLGSTINRHLELDGLVASDHQDFVRKGVQWASDLKALSELRMGMRERFRRSPIGRADLVAGGLMANAAKRGERLIAGARKLAERHPIIGDVRGRGLMIGMELVKDRTTKEYNPEASRRIVDTAFQHGLLLLGCGKSTIRLAPPLVIDEVDIDRGLELLGEVLNT